MSSPQPFMISAYSKGLVNNKKPFLLMDSAFQTLENAYIWREAVKKREGIKLVGRLQRNLSAGAVLSTTAVGASYTNADVLNDSAFALRATEPNAQIVPGSVSITVSGGGGVFVDTAQTGILSSASGSGYINYATGALFLSFTVPLVGARTVTVVLNYYPALPVMGIDIKEETATNDETTVFFDTKYVYTYNDTDFSSPSTTTWAGGDSDFFWMSNYRGTAVNDRLIFVTNFTAPSISASNRIRHSADLITWTAFTPLVSATESIFQTKLIISYYGRLLFLNTYEGTAAGTAVNYFNRCRFSQIGNPLLADAWRSDLFGKGGFIDAPTSEEMISCRFYKNTLIVFFERSTWELRYVGEYGLPFIWERISSDFGSESAFSTVLFDQGVLAVGDKAIVTSSGGNVERIDQEVPDTVFSFHNLNNGKERVHGIRDFQKEIVYWCYSDGPLGNKFPNRVLLYNYRNNTWAVFRDNATCFGLLTNASGDSWDTPISWDSDTKWEGFYQGEFPTVVSGNQEGFVHYYQFFLDPDPTIDYQIEFREHESLAVTDITRNTTTALRLEIPDHNLEDLDIIYLTGLLFITTATRTALASTLLNDNFYQVTVFDNDNVDLTIYDPSNDVYETTSSDNIGYTPAPGTGTYVGGGVVALMPKLNILTKDFNPFQDKGMRFKTNFVDFQTDASPAAEVSINLYVDSSLAITANLPVYNPNMVTDINQVGTISGATQANPCSITSTNHGLSTGRQLTIGNVVGMTQLNSSLFTITVVNENTFTLDAIDSSAYTAYTSGGTWHTQDANGYYMPGAQYAWHRFYSNVFGQYISYQITYNDALMNDPVTHNSDFELNAMTIWAKPGGRLT